MMSLSNPQIDREGRIVSGTSFAGSRPSFGTLDGCPRRPEGGNEKWI